MGHFASGFERLRTGEDPNAPQWSSLIARLADGSALAPLAGRAAVERADIEDLKSRVGVEDLRRQVAELKGTLAEYKTTMDGLKHLVTRGGGG